MSSAIPAVSTPEISAQLQRAQDGSQEAMGEVLQLCRNYLLVIANNELDQDVQAKAGASDIVQDTFLEAQRDFQQFSGASDQELLAWLRRILLNNLSNFRRRYKNAAKREVRREISLCSGSNGVSALGAQLCDDGATPSEYAANHEERVAIEKALSRLSTRYRQVVTWRQRDQWSFVQIAKVLNCSPEAARKTWVRAIEHLARELQTKHDE